MNEEKLVRCSYCNFPINISESIKVSGGKVLAHTYCAKAISIKQKEQDEKVKKLKEKFADLKKPSKLGYTYYAIGNREVLSEIDKIFSMQDKVEG